MERAGCGESGPAFVCLMPQCPALLKRLQRHGVAFALDGDLRKYGARLWGNMRAHAF